MEPYAEIAEAIIKKQVLVLADMALERARKVNGLTIDASGGVQKLEGGAQAIEKLIGQYQELLGPAALSFAREAALPIAKKHPDIELPQALRG